MIPPEPNTAFQIKPTVTVTTPLQPSAMALQIATALASNPQLIELISGPTAPTQLAAYADAVVAALMADWTLRKWWWE